MQELTTFFKILGDSNRLKIFDLLMTGTHCNCELSGKIGLANNLISHHLKVLTEANLITAERSPTDARWIYYSINQKEVAKYQAIIQAHLDTSRIQPRQPVCPPCKPHNKNNPPTTD